MRALRAAVVLVLALALPAQASADTKACEDAYLFTVDELVAGVPFRDHYEAALKECRPLAEQGYAKAQYYLGRMYYNGWV